MSDRRQHPRYSVNWRARVLFPDKSILSAKVEDVSIGGVFVTVGRGASVGAHVSVEFYAVYRGGNKRIRAKTVVAFSILLSDNRGAGLGLRFTGIGSDDMHCIKNIVQELSDNQE